MVERENPRHAADACQPETRLYSLWEAHAATGARLRTLSHKEVIVLSRGVRNDGPGPDYRDAVLIVEGRLAVGAVEMHRQEGDWFLHGHDRDPAYERVIVHVLGARPQRQMLAIPTIIASSIPTQSQMPARPASAAGSHAEISRELLADAAWDRLLRRVTEIIRADESMPTTARVRRAFIVRLFDCLGYAANRRPMRAIGQRLVADGTFDEAGGSSCSGVGFDSIAAHLFGYAGVDPLIVGRLADGFMSDGRLRRILDARPEALGGIRWTRATRPANAPERRLWGAARLLAEIIHGSKLERLLAAISNGASWHQLERELVIRLGGQSFIGASRSAEIVMNALLPAALASGILDESITLIEGACGLYRNAPAQGSNRTLRLIERRYLGGRALAGGFWQQGAIEHYQRYLSPDRSALRFLADDNARYRAV